MQQLHAEKTMQEGQVCVLFMNILLQPGHNMYFKHLQTALTCLHMTKIVKGVMSVKHETGSRRPSCFWPGILYDFVLI